MEIPLNRQGPPLTLQSGQVKTSPAARPVLPQSGKELPSVADKAPPKVPEIEAPDLQQAMEDLQAYVDGLGRSLSFQRDDSIDKNVITVVDSSTNQVVRQIPSEEVVAIARQLRDELADLRAGLLMEDKI